MFVLQSSTSYTAKFCAVLYPTSRTRTAEYVHVSTHRASTRVRGNAAQKRESRALRARQQRSEKNNNNVLGFVQENLGSGSWFGGVFFMHWFTLFVDEG